MANSYLIRVRTPQGQLLAETARFSKLTYSLVENAVGALSLTLGQEIPDAWTQEDTRLEVWRSVDGGPYTLEGDTCWLVRLPADSLDQAGADTRTLTAYDLKELLRRRIVAYPAGLSQTAKSTYLDDAMKQVVDENLGAFAEPGRSLSTYLVVAGSNSAAPQGALAFAFKNVLTVLQDMANASAQAGTYLTFDILYDPNAAVPFTFQTFLNWRGVDHRLPAPGSVLTGGGTPVVLTPEGGTLSTVRLAKDYTLEVTVAYGGGAGQGATRVFSAVIDPRSTATPFNRIEVFLNASNLTPAQMTQALQAELRNGRPRLTFTGRVNDTGDALYGRDYRHGDVVTASWKGEAFNCHVTPVTVTVDEQQGEVINCNLASDVLL